jgi:hypothetical protein
MFTPGAQPNGDSLQIRDARSCRLLLTLKGGLSIGLLLFSSDGTRLFGSSGMVCVFGTSALPPGPGGGRLGAGTTLGFPSICNNPTHILYPTSTAVSPST